MLKKRISSDGRKNNRAKRTSQPFLKQKSKKSKNKSKRLVSFKKNASIKKSKGVSNLKKASHTNTKKSSNKKTRLHLKNNHLHKSQEVSQVSKNNLLINNQTFLGVSLSGGKNDKTTVTEIVYYKEYNKLFIKEVFDNIESTDTVSSDSILLDILNSKKIHSVGIDAPLFLPFCFQNKCLGVENCKHPTSLWHWQHYKKHKKRKKNLKLFTPYTERCVEKYINYELEEFFEIPEALGANKAPITARSIYLKRKIKNKLIEVFPKLSTYRLGLKFKLTKRDLMNYRHVVYGVHCRSLIIESLVNSGFLFIYHQDVQKFIDSPNAFDSLICALTAYLKSQKQCEEPPQAFPLQEGWIAFPKIDFKMPGEQR